MSEDGQHARANDSIGKDGADAAILTEIRDVNERLLIAGLHEQELAEQLRFQLAFTNTITDTLGEGICALDEESRIAFINPAASNLLGFAESELVGQSLHDIVHDHRGTSCQFGNALREGKASRDDDIFLRVDGTQYPVAYSVAPIVTNDRVVGTVVAFRDVTEYRRFETMQARLLEQEQKARTAAEASVRIRSEVLNAVSHDLRQPLTVIKGTAQLLARHTIYLGISDQSRFAEGLGRIDTSVMKMMAIIHELLDVAQMGAGEHLVLERFPVDLVALVRQVMAEHEHMTNHRLVLEVAEESLVGNWDARRLERVFTNVLSNATKYSSGDHSVVLRLTRDIAAPDSVVIEIRDEGIGIPAADLSHIFERFYRGSNAISGTTGIGIGLSGSKEIVEQHGGVISISSVEGIGTTITVRLPGLEQV